MGHVVAGGTLRSLLWNQAGAMCPAGMSTGGMVMDCPSTHCLLPDLWGCCTGSPVALPPLPNAAFFSLIATFQSSSILTFL